MTPSITQTPIEDHDRFMKAAEWRGAGDIQINSKHPMPLITQEKDAIIRVSCTSICGTDLHLYHKEITGSESKYILGHECVGTVVAIGPEVKTLAVDDRVVIASQIIDSLCEYCQNGQTSLCELNTRVNEENCLKGGVMTAGLLGFPVSLNGFPGTQAEYVRIPLADVNCLKIPTDWEQVNDENAILLSDVLCTAWHANEMAQVQKNDTVAIWGAGPIGIVTAYLAKHRGASRIVLIDKIVHRLDLAKAHIKDLEVINFEKENDVVGTIRSMFSSEGYGPDVAIDCVGFRYTKSWKHEVEKSLYLQTADSIDSLRECILSIKKGGRVSFVGDYIKEAHGFPIGPLMEKSLILKGARVYNQTYWKGLLEKLVKKEIDPSFIFTHKIDFDAIPNAYKLFDKKTDGMIKCIIVTGVGHL